MAEVIEKRLFFPRQSATTFLACYILHILEAQPLHGNAILRELDKRFGGHWRPSPGTIYPLLSAMENDGHIRGVWNDPQKRHIKTYHLTDLGKERLEIGKKQLLPLLKDTEAIIHAAYKDLFR
jgi:DNA-binding PadR family transcriptional regulator